LIGILRKCCDSLILLPVTGSSGGKRKRTVVKLMYNKETYQRVFSILLTRKKVNSIKFKHTMFNTQPRRLGSTKCLSGSMLRPRRQWTAIGIPYERSSNTTEADMIALKAL
jgi:hypothetical protein